MDEEFNKRDFLLGTKEICDILGVTPNALRNYEKHGAINSVRKENGYREYMFNDIQQLLYFKSLISMGFSVSDASAFMKMRTVEEVDSMLEEEIGKQEKELQRIEKTIAYTRRKKRDISRISTECGVFDITVRPGFYFSQYTNANEDEKEHLKEMKVFAEYSPFVESCPKIAQKYLNPSIVADIGLCVKDTYADMIHGDILIRMEHMAPRKCLHTITFAGRHLDDYYSVVEKGLSELERRGYVLDGDIYSLLIAANYSLNDTKPMDYYDCYFPFAIKK